MKLRKMMLAAGFLGVLLVMVVSQIAAQENTATPKQLLDEAKKLYAAHNYEGSLKRLEKVDKAKLGVFEKWDYESLLGKTKKAVEGKAADEQALAEGKTALNEQNYSVAVEKLSQAANSGYLEDEKRGLAKGLLQVAKDKQKTAAKAPKVVAKAEAKPAVEAKAEEKPADEIAVVLEPPAKPTVQPAEPVVQPAEPVVQPAEPVVQPVEVKMPEAVPAAPTLAVAEDARRAEAEDEMQLGDETLASHEYEKARIHFSRALSLWPGSERAKKGLDGAMRLLAEREEPLADVVRDVRGLERQRIMAEVQELLAQAERAVAEARRPEDYAESLRPLDQANRTIDVARVLSVEEQESLREEVLTLRKDIEIRQDQATTTREARASAETKLSDEQRRKADQLDRENKVKQLWDRVGELRKSMQFAEAIQVLDRLIAVDPNDERALRWREDLLYLEAQARQVDVRRTRRSETVEALVDSEESAIAPGEKVHGETKFLRYPEAKDWKELTEFRREFTKAVSAEPKAVAETRRRLSEEIDLDFEKTSLDNVLKYISEVQRGLNVVIDPDVSAAGIDLSSRVVDLKVKRISVESVLGLILGTDLGYKVEAGYILVTTKDKLQQNLPVVTYPVQDLVAQIPEFEDAPRFNVADVIQGVTAAAAGGGGFGGIFGAGAAAAAQPVGWQELVDIIQRTINKQSDPNVADWAEAGGPAAIEYMNGLLIVSQTRRGHERMADLLEQLRRERAIMISIEARFCQVSDEFLQDITLDADITINQPGQHWTGDVTAPITPAPIVIESTGSGGMGTSKLLPLAGTAFATFTANEGGMVVSGTFLDDIQVGFLLRAIQADVRSTTLQAPRITLYNGQRAYITDLTVVTYISDATPVVSEAAVGWDPTVSAVPVGATLDVKASVSADRRYVQMDLRPQQAALGTPPFRFVTVQAAAIVVASTTIELPQIIVQDYKTTVSVPDGGTLLLGGTRRYTETEAETGVPILSKVPILKRLFNNRASQRSAKNLLILIRPKIIIQSEEEDKLGYDDF